MTSVTAAKPRRAKASGGISKRTTASGQDRYEARVSLPSQPGKPRRQYGKTFSARADAQRWLNVQLSAVANGTASEDHRMTLGTWLERWLASHDVRPTTRRGYSDLMTAHVIPRIGATRLVDLRPGHLTALYLSVMEDSAKPGEDGRKRRPVGPSTVAKINAVLSSALADAERDGYVPRNVARLARLPKVTKAPREVWTVEQVRAFTQATAEDRLAALWLLLFRTGLRRGEALGLRWEDVDLEAQPGSYPQARVVQQVISVGGEIQRGEPKTENGRRVVALDPTVVAALKAWRAQQATDRLAAGPAWAGDPEIFTREDGRVLDPGYVSKRFQRLAAVAGLPVMRLHDTRHTNLSHLLAAGVPVADVSKLAGHADIRTTVNTYGHIQADNRLAAALLLAARLDG
jgi:integrase